ncbi:MAG: hypothetical protein NC412_09095 [Roseburia sp.]|nr:hypothetical protein [Roseburia sp.]MCM1279219.1 hypothetical protein [Robinsoniella sp.]
MKHLYRISLFLNAGFLLFAAYNYGKSLFYREPVREEQAPIIQNITMVEEEKADKQEEMDTADREIPVTSQKASTTADTVYIVESYDHGTEETTKKEEKIPDQYIGKTREELEDIISAYSDAPSLSDLEKGFASMELKSFSPNRLVVTKNYYSNLNNENFYLLVENEYINVYYSDLKTVYLYTDILLSDLPEDIQQDILNKKYIESEEELYNFLESYSS